MRYMKYYILSAAATVLLLSGCGAGQSAASQGGARQQVQPKDAVTDEAAPAGAGNVTAASDAPAGDAPSGETAIPTEDGNAAASAAAENGGAGGISEEEAKAIALEDAGISEQDATGIRIKMDVDDGIQEYEVEFYVGNTEYDYDIEAASGKIRSKDMDIENDFLNTAPAGAIISEEEAGKIALEKVPGATQSNMKLQLENDDGRTIYEGTIIYDGTEYEFEIDAAGGVIVKWEEEFS